MPLREVHFIGQSTPSDNIENNILSYLNWELLGACAYVNVNVSTSGSYGGDASRLKLSNAPGYTSGRVWESFRKQWVWQSGTECSSAQPIAVSGVYVNGTFQPATGVGPYSFKIDYPNGRVIFDTAISRTATVKAGYSFNYYQLYNSDSPIWRDIQRNSFRVDDSSFLITSSGFWARPVENRLQLPAVIIQATPEIVKKTPYQIGSLVNLTEQNYRFYIITETNRDLKWITDAITCQNEEMHHTFDTNAMWLSGVYPLNMETGSLNNAALNYPDLVSNFGNNNFWSFRKFRGYIPEGFGKESTAPLFFASIISTVETMLE